MKYTSAEAAKLLRRLNDEIAAEQQLEAQSREFVVAVTEVPDDVRPEYDYAAVNARIDALQASVRRLKHAINVFNATHTVPGFEMTIDEMLVYLPQLKAKKEKLAAMKVKLPRAREQSYGRSNSGVIEYRYVNYSIKDVAADFDAVSEELSRAQNALDLVNSTETLEFDQ